MSETSSLTYEELKKYKEVNKSLPPDLHSYIKSLGSLKHTRGGAWRRPDKGNNWLVQMKFNQDADDKLYAQFRSLLNKISDGNFDQIAKEIVELQINKKYHVERLVDLIFQKAISEEKFNEMYAKLSTELKSYYIVDDDDQKILFREALINKCQQMFNQAISIDKDAEAGTEGNMFKYKEQVQGCLSFVGQLYLHDLLTDKIIHSCFSLLFAKAVLNKAYIVDSLCTLMTTVGKKFLERCPKEGQNCLDRMTKLKGELKSMKEKFAILNVLETAKKENWGQ